MKTIRVMLSVLALVLLSAPALAAPDCPPRPTPTPTPTPTPPPSAVEMVEAGGQSRLLLNIAAFFFGLLIGGVIAALESRRGKR